jgi:hypothetical protein
MTLLHHRNFQKNKPYNKYIFNCNNNGSSLLTVNWSWKLPRNIEAFGFTESEKALKYYTDPVQHYVFTKICSFLSRILISLLNQIFNCEHFLLRLYLFSFLPFITMGWLVVFIELYNITRKEENFISFKDAFQDPGFMHVVLEVIIIVESLFLQWTKYSKLLYRTYFLPLA